MSRSLRRLGRRTTLTLTGASAAVLVAVAVGAAGQDTSGREPRTTTPDAIQWTPNPQVRGVSSANIVGSPADRALYVTLGKMQRGAVFPSHSHPDTRITTVLSGTMYFGTGSVFDRDRVRAYPAGSIVQTPPGVAHYMWAKDGETIMQETGVGPTGLTPSPAR